MICWENLKLDKRNAWKLKLFLEQKKTFDEMQIWFRWKLQYSLRLDFEKRS